MSPQTAAPVWLGCAHATGSPGDLSNVAVVGHGVLPVVNLLLSPHQDAFVRLQVGRHCGRRRLRITTGENEINTRTRLATQTTVQGNAEAVTRAVLWAPHQMSPGQSTPQYTQELSAQQTQHSS